MHLLYIHTCTYPLRIQHTTLNSLHQKLSRNILFDNGLHVENDLSLFLPMLLVVLPKLKSKLARNQIEKERKEKKGKKCKSYMFDILRMCQLIFSSILIMILFIVMNLILVLIIAMMPRSQLSIHPSINQSISPHAMPRPSAGGTVFDYFSLSRKEQYKPRNPATYSHYY